MRALVLVVIASLITLTSCGTPSTPKQAPMSGSSQIPIGLAEYMITVPQLLARPGPLALQVTNVGAAAHNLAVSQDGKVLGTTRTLHPGEVQRLTVLIRGHGGELRLVCTLPGHDTAGMHATLAVGR